MSKAHPKTPAQSTHAGPRPATNPTVVKTPHSEKPAPAATPWRDLTPLQERASELCSDLIQNGGNEKDVKLLLQALIRHESRRHSPGEDRESVTADGRVIKHNGPQERADKWTPEWYTGLAREWPVKHQETDEPAVPNTVGEMIRLNVRHTLRWEFEAFLNGSEGLADLWLLQEVLVHCECGSRIGSGLGEAFAYQLDSSDTYMRVPYKLRKRVKQILALIEKREDTRGDAA